MSWRKVREIVLEKDTKFVRVYDGDKSGMKGGWFMRAEDVAGLSPEQIQAKYALPQTPKYICDVEFPSGTQVREGIANEIAGWDKGGGIQYDVVPRRIGIFSNERLIGGK